MIDFRDREKIKTLLQALPEDRPPLFGRMMPQQMIEHLTQTLEFSINKKPQQFHGKTERLPLLRDFIRSNREIEPGFRSPVFPEKPMPVQYESINKAIDVLLSNIDDFENYFQHNQESKTMNPVFGELNYDDWIRFHSKHFTHHFKQFGLLEMPVMKIAKDYAFEYEWGTDCKGWHLVNQRSLGIIQEMMPPHTEETRHFHHHARQFFFMLKGKATFDVNDQRTKVSAGEGIYISPNILHKIKNESEEPIEFLVISQPHSHGDRQNAEK